MKQLLRCFATSLVLAANPALADLFLLGDSTPIHALNDNNVRAAVEGNQQLFLRFAKAANSEESPRVLWRFGERISEATGWELDAFFQRNDIYAGEASSLSPHALADVGLLIIGNPEWSWEPDEVSAVAALLGRGGNVVLIVEPNNSCDARCQKSTAALLQSLGSSLRVGPERDVRGTIAKPTAHPFMQGIGPIEYGSTHTIEGGKALLDHGQDDSMLSVDDQDFRALSNSPDET